MWFTVWTAGFIVLIRSLVIAAAMRPGEEVTLWIMMQIAGPLAAWIIILVTAYIVERVLDEDDR